MLLSAGGGQRRWQRTVGWESGGVRAVTVAVAAAAAAAGAALPAVVPARMVRAGCAALRAGQRMQRAAREVLLAAARRWQRQARHSCACWPARRGGSCLWTWCAWTGRRASRQSRCEGPCATGRAAPCVRLRPRAVQPPRCGALEHEHVRPAAPALGSERGPAGARAHAREHTQVHMLNAHAGQSMCTSMHVLVLTVHARTQQHTHARA